MLWSEKAETIVNEFSELSLADLEFVNSHLSQMLKIRRQTEVSTDLRPRANETGRKQTLGERARATLENLELEHDFTLADRALLASVVLSEQYSQSTFSSREINNIIEECGRGRIAHITSAIAGLKEKSFLVEESDKELALSPEGKLKAKALIDMIHRSEAIKAA